MRYKQYAKFRSGEDKENMAIFSRKFTTEATKNELSMF